MRVVDLHRRYPVRLGALALLTAVLASLVLGATIARAASWSIQTTPNASGADDSALYDMSCEPASTTACTAVGKQTTGGVSTPYAQYWNGSSWVNQSAAAPSGATASELQSNHCLTKTSCVAAGSYTNASGTFSLVEAWNGTSWSIQATPNPTGATETRLKGVSCRAITACIAVGYSVGPGGMSAVAMRGNSGSWSLQTFPVPSGATSSELNGVECTSATSCVAVGRYTVSGGAYWAMSATWDGTSWTLKTVPNPSGALRSVLLDVSCSDASNCTAVGGYRNSSNVQQSFVARWNGTSWSHQTSPNPSGSSNTVLQNVSCADRYSCVAVGDWLSSGTWQPMAQRWNGNGWSLDTTPSPSGATFGLLEGVACRIECLAVGWYTDSSGNDKTLGEIRDIPTWTQRALPAPTSSIDTLSGVACWATNSCFAVGTGASIARVYQGGGSGAWSANATPRFPTATYSQLRDVSCRTVSTSSTCLAVGVHREPENGNIEKPYAASWWNGSGLWDLSTVVLPSGVSSGVLNDVSCPPGTFTCVAVGDFKSGGIARTYAAAYNGGSWTLQSTPNSGSDDNVLTSVSCTSASACTAVGYVESGILRQPLVMRWNGTSWAIQTSALPTGALTGSLHGVSCTSATDCMAVGGYSDSGGSHTYVTRWNGTSWTTQASPRLAFGNSRFEDVACTSTTACVAVGTYGASIGSLAAEWDGTSWTVHDAPSPGATGNVLLGVTCPASGSCRAAGHQSASGATHNLVVTYP